MDRKKVIAGSSSEKLFNELNDLKEHFSEAFKKRFERSLPFSEELFDRWERANKLGFGEGTSIYDNSFVFGKVTVGQNCWIGPFTIIDGSGELSIGDHCTISSGVHIYTHDNVKKTLSGGKLPIEHAEVSIGNYCYIGPQSIISKGVRIGNNCVVAVNSFVNKNIEDLSIVAGNPAKKIGNVIIAGDEITFEYF
jgi:acetyltransferase-like isoleucine patch superfamily enzyme